MSCARRIREEKNYTRREVAKEIGVTEQTIARFELNKQIANGRTLTALADFYNVSIDELLGREVKS